MSEDNINPVIQDAVQEPKKRKRKSKYTPEQMKECEDRVSCFGGKYPGSYPSQWTLYPKDNWVHKTELRTFINHYTQCFHSKDWLRRSEMLRDVEGNCVSSAEKDRKGWVQCCETEHWGPRELMQEVWVGNNQVLALKSCIEDGAFFRCEASNRFYHRHSRVRVMGGNTPYRWVAIEQAEAANIWRCSNCESWFHRGDLIQLNRGFRCHPCQQKLDNKGLIHPHNFTGYPEPIFKPTSCWRMVGSGKNRAASISNSFSNRLFGVECETELYLKGCQKHGVARHAVAQDVLSNLGKDFVILKEDGSLNMNGHYGGGDGSSYAGFEIVTAPASLDVHRHRWMALERSERYPLLRASDTETCGMHVHVSKAALTTLQIGRILVMMNNDDNKPFIAKVAGRSENRYCRSFHKERIAEGITYSDCRVEGDIEYVRADFIQQRSDDARRQAVNITNAKTIEFRIFRGTVNPRHIIRNLEFVDAVCSFCHAGSRSFKELKDFRYFIDYVGKQRKLWPLLTGWMESDKIGMLLAGKNAYGPKDFRGQKKPEIDEDIHRVNAPEEPIPVLRLQDAWRAIARPNAEAVIDERHERRPIIAAPLGYDWNHVPDNPDAEDDHEDHAYIA